MLQQILKIIPATINADSDLSATLSSDVYFDEVPPDGTVGMPYITYHVVGGPSPMMVFDPNTSWDEVLVQVSIFEDTLHNPAAIEIIASDVDLLFHRQILSFDGATHVGCVRSGGTGPTRLDDCWQRTIDYTIELL